MLIIGQEAILFDEQNFFHYTPAIMVIDSESTDFHTGQHVVYPLQGVGTIEDIEERVFNDKKVLYYVIYINVSDMVIRIPVSTAPEQGIRAIVGEKESEEALEIIATEYEPTPTDWKLRYQMNLDLLRRGDIADIATVVRTLYHRSRLKELPILERKLYDTALNLLVDEVSFSLGKEKTEIEQLIYLKLESSN